MVLALRRRKRGLVRRRGKRRMVIRRGIGETMKLAAKRTVPMTGKVYSVMERVTMVIEVTLVMRRAIEVTPVMERVIQVMMLM